MSPSLTTDAPKLDPHEEATLLLPWYANGTLSPEETRQVEKHLGQCPTCRAELAQYRVLADRVVEQPGLAWQPPAGHFDRLMTDIDRLETQAACNNPKTSMLQQVMDWLRETPPPVRWTLAAESLAVAALVLVVLLPGRPPVEPGFETLSSGAQPPTAPGPRLRVAFDPLITAGDIQALLQRVNGQIVAGPSVLGIYTITLETGDRPNATLEHALTVLQGNDHVRLAEPLQPPE